MIQSSSLFEWEKYLKGKISLRECKPAERTPSNLSLATRYILLKELTYYPLVFDAFALMDWNITHFAMTSGP